jgi:hypothetical protein
VHAIPARASAAPTSSIAASTDDEIDVDDAGALLDAVDEAGCVGNEFVAATDVDADVELLGLLGLLGPQPVTPTTSRAANAPTEHRLRLNTTWAFSMTGDTHPLPLLTAGGVGATSNGVFVGSTGGRATLQ